MSTLRDDILNKSWKSRGAGWTLKAPWADKPSAYYQHKKVVPRYGTVFTCVDANPVSLPGFLTKRHSENDQGKLEIIAKGPEDKSIKCVKFEVSESVTIPSVMVDPDPNDPHEPPLEKMEPSYVASFEKVIFRVMEDYLIAPMTEIEYNYSPQFATMIVTFDELGTMTLKSYWDDGYFGGYCCPKFP